MSRLRSLLLALPVILSAPVARAGLLDGRFSGTGTDGSTFLSGAPGNVNGFADLAGTSITGAFDLSTVAGAITMQPYYSPSAYFLPPGTITMTFDLTAIQQIVTLHSDYDDLADLEDDGSSQSVTLTTNVMDPHLSRGTLVLNGPEGSLFTDVLDPASLHIGAGVSLVSAGFSLYGDGGANVDVATESLGAPVGEPPGWTTLAVSAIGLLALRRRA